MAATVSPWATKPGAWALDAEKQEAELLEQQKDTQNTEPLADFPSLASAAATKPKKKKGQTVSLAEFTAYGSAKPTQPSEPKGLTHEDLLMLPTGPRQRSAEELDRSRLGGGFKSYGMNSSRYGSNSNGDDSSNSRWGSSRVSDERRHGGFGRDAPRESAPSRADEIDDWAAAKKSPVGNGFERRERSREFFDSQSKADEVDSWVSNKSVAPRRFGDNNNGGGFERRGSFDSLSRGKGEREMSSNGGGRTADLDNWGRRKEEGNSGSGGGRPRLVLQPRTVPLNNDGGKKEGAEAVKPKGASPFGEARPREEVLAEKRKDWKEIDEKLESMKIKEAATEKAERNESGFGKRSFGTGKGFATGDDRTERGWRKSDSVDSHAHPPSSEKSVDGN